MKIKKLVIHNIASIIDTTIDFTTHPLADESIFLITGNTGSGKTTVLNAICMALYNKVPSLNIAPRDRDTAGMMVNSAMQLARRDADDSASVVLSYDGKDGRQYEISWLLEKYTRGENKGKFKNSPERMLTRLAAGDQAEERFDRVKDIDEMVLKTVDLTFDQFCRTTMLAQGQFLKFLESSEEEKCEILEKLTGTEIYKRIGQEVNALFKASEAECNKLKDKLQAVRDQLLSDEAVAKAEDDMATLAEQSKQLQESQEEARRQASWLEAKQKLDDKLKRAKDELEAAKAVDVSEAREKIKAWDDTSKIRAILAREKELANDLNEIEQTDERIAEEAAAVRKGQESMRAKLGQCQNCIKKFDADLDQHQGNKDLYENLGQIKMIAGNIASDIKSVNDNDSKADDLKKSIGESEKKLGEIEKRTVEAKDKYEKAEKAHKVLENKKKVYDIAQINSKKTALAKKKEALTGLKTALQTYAEKSDDLKKEQDELAVKRQALADANAALPQLEETCKESDENLKTLRDKLQGQMDLKDKLAELKAIFQDEKKCPLCGSTDGHICAEDVISEAIEEASRKVKDAEEKWKQALTALNKKKTEAKSLDSDISKQEEKLRTASRLEVKAKNELDKAKTSAGAPADGDLQTWADARIAEAQQDIDACDKELAAASEAIKLCDESQKELNNLRKKYDEANDALNKIKQKVEKGKADQKNFRDIAKTKREDIKKYSDQLIALLPEHDPMYAALQEEGMPKGLDAHVSRIEESKNAYENLLAKKSEEERKSEGLKVQIGEIDDIFVSMPNLKPSDKEGIAEAKDALGLCKKVKEDYGGQEALRSRNAAETRKAKSEENDYFKSHDRDLTMKQIDILAGNPGEKDAAEWRKAVHDLDNRLEVAQKFVDSYTKELERHIENKPDNLADDADVASIKNTLNTLINDHKKAITEHARIEGELNNNNKLKATVAEDLPRLETLERECNEWRAIDAMFGTTSSRNRFGVIAQRFIFNQLLERANQYLQQLNPRYSLKCRLDSMQIYVVDRYLGDTERVANGLSGGEGFIASLSLALALSSINSDRESVDTIFIDEGFGTLSGELLQTVIDMLDTLHNESGRRVGIISHIDFLKERIQTKICLEPIPGKSASNVSIVSC